MYCLSSNVLSVLYHVLSVLFHVLSVLPLKDRQYIEGQTIR
jgi:hypothetical protein